MSTINVPVVASRITAHRLGSYLAAAGLGLQAAVALYDWSTQAAGALHEDIARLEVVFRNTLDSALVVHGGALARPTVWYQRSSLFPGKHGRRATDEIRTDRARASRRGAAETHGKVIAGLSFGFWRFLCSPPYLTSLWVPALTQAFPNHPDAGDPRAVRHDVDDRIQRVHFLRNRIAHHEPIHQRDLPSDLEAMLDVTGWICADTRLWLATTSRTLDVLRRRPGPAQ